MTSPFKPEQVLCLRHGEPFRSDWPNGYSAFVTTVAGHVLADSRFLDEIERNFNRIGAALDKSPLCCRASSDILIRAYTEARIGKTARCSKCGKTALGTLYYYTNHWNRTKLYPHLCFHCVTKLPPPKSKRK